MAGLLDSLFDPSSYGGSGGLLARLQPLIGDIGASSGFPDQPASFAQRFNAPQPFRPSGRSFDSASFDPATFAPNQAQPISVGGYQMPRIGSADLYQPTTTDISAQSRTLPPNAQPTQGVLPQQPEQEQPLPPAFGGNYLDRVRAGGGLVRSLFGDTAAQQNLKAVYTATRQALIDNGMSPQQASSTAMLAALNPEAAKTILPEALTSKEKYQVISEDPLEGKKYGFVNDRAQTVNGQPIAPNGSQPTSSGGGLAALQQAQNAGVTGDALYGYLPPAYRNTVKAMIEGRQPLPSTTAMRSPATLALIDAAHAIDQSFDATVWKARNEAGPDWTKGKSSEMVRAANQTLAHVGSLMDAMDKLGNTRFPIANAVKNTVNEQIGGGEPGSFRTNAHAVAEEMSKVFKGANLSDSEIRHWEQNLSENMSPEQQRAQIAKLSELLHGSLQALEEKRLTAMGPAMAEKQGPLIKAEGQKVLERIDQWLKGNAAPAAQPASTLPQGWSVKVR